MIDDWSTDALLFLILEGLKPSIFDGETPIYLGYADAGVEGEKTSVCSSMTRESVS